MSQFERYFLSAQVRMWNDLPDTVFGKGTMDLTEQSTVDAGCAELCFSVFPGAGACGVPKAINKLFDFFHMEKNIYIEYICVCVCV